MQVLEISVNIFPQMDKPVITFTPRRFVCCQAQRRDELVVSETPLASDTGIRIMIFANKFPARLNVLLEDMQVIMRVESGKREAAGV